MDGREPLSENSLMCANCSSRIRNPHVGTRCPNCSFLIGHLLYEGRDWVYQIKLGARLLHIALLCSLPAFLFGGATVLHHSFEKGVFAESPGLEIARYLAIVTFLIFWMFLIGGLLIVTARPNVFHWAGVSRIACRIFVLFEILLVGYLVWTLFSEPKETPDWLKHHYFRLMALLLAMILSLASGCQYLAMLLRRTAAEQVAYMMWYRSRFFLVLGIIFAGALIAAPKVNAEKWGLYCLSLIIVAGIWMIQRFLLLITSCDSCAKGLKECLEVRLDRESK